MFLQGLKEHGKGWKEIAELVKTRTVVQIRTHAQKYFLKLSKDEAQVDEASPTIAAHRRKQAKKRVLDQMSPTSISDVCSRSPALVEALHIPSPLASSPP